jgi:hypothetical protein
VNVIVQLANDLSVAAPSAIIEVLEVFLILALLSLRFVVDILFGTQRERVLWLAQAARVSTVPLLILVIGMVVGKVVS